MSKLIAYHGKQSIKDALIAQLEAHYAADEIIKGIYWENGKGSAVGCTVHSGSYIEYEIRLGIPRLLGRIEETIFQGLPNKSSKEFPLEFAKSINVGADLSKVWPQFAVWMLIDEKFGVLQYAETAEQKSIIKKIANLYLENRIVSMEEWRDAARIARDFTKFTNISAAYAVSSAARIADAGENDENDAIASAQAVTDVSDTYVVSYALETDIAAVIAITDATDAATAYALDAAAINANAVCAAAISKTRTAQKDKLLELLCQCK